jgi:ABC-type bacteriocin/lantibiotic exporter with double-glycine peptidase domain
LKALERLPLEERGEPVSLSGVIGVTMENVSFSYTDEGKLVFSNFTHDFKPGSLTAVIGETGVGKSTLIRMLLALVIPQKDTYVSIQKHVKAKLFLL